MPHLKNRFIFKKTARWHIKIVYIGEFVSSNYSFFVEKWVIDLSLVVSLNGVRQLRKNGSLIYLIASGSHTLITCVLHE